MVKTIFCKSRYFCKIENLLDRVFWVNYNVHTECLVECYETWIGTFNKQFVKWLIRLKVKLFIFARYRKCMHTRKKTQTEVRSQEMKTGLTPDCQPGPTLSKTTSILTQKGVYFTLSLRFYFSPKCKGTLWGSRDLAFETNPPCFSNMKHLRVLLLPLDGMVVHHRRITLTTLSRSMSLVTIYNRLV